MGTSASSKGPNSGVPFDPPWLDDIDIPVSDNQETNNDQDENEQEQDSEDLVPTIAPPRRFRNARIQLGQFLNTGNHDSLRKSIGYYSREGMGGSRNSTARMRVSSRAATGLFNFLRNAREGNDPSINQWVNSLTNRNASTDDIINEIINRVAPDGGSNDETSCRRSMAQAMNELIERDASVDLLKLSDESIWFLIESFLGYEAFSRLCLDIGKAFESSSLSARDKVTRLNDMQEYLKAEISAQVKSLRHRSSNSATSPKQLLKIINGAIKNTFDVYEGSI